MRRGYSAVTIDPIDKSLQLASAYLLELVTCYLLKGKP